MKIEERKLSEITPYDNNPRQNDAAVDAVAASIQEFGFRQRYRGTVFPIPQPLSPRPIKCLEI